MNNDGQEPMRTNRNTSTFELAVIFACEDIPTQPVGLDLYLPNFL